MAEQSCSGIILWEDIEVMESCGRSLYGSVHRGWIESFAMQVMVSLIDREHCDPGFEEELRKVIVQLKRFRHPNILLVVGMSISPEGVAVVTEWCSKGSFEDLLSNSDFVMNTAFTLKIMLSCSRAITYLESEHGIQHGAICPQNIMVDHNSSPKIILRKGFRLLEFIPPAVIQQTHGNITEKASFPLAKPVPSRFIGNGPHKDAFAFGMVLLECFAREPASINCLYLISYPIRSLIEWCILVDAEKRPSFVSISSFLDEAFATESILSKTYDVPRIKSFLTSDAVHLKKLAAKEIAETVPLHGNESTCSQCGHFPNFKARAEMLCKNGFIQLLLDNMSFYDISVRSWTIVALAGLLQVMQSFRFGKSDIQSGLVRIIIDLISSIDREISHSARNVLMRIAEDVEKITEILQTLDQFYARRLLEQLRGDLYQTKSRIVELERVVEMKENRLFEFNERFKQIESIGSSVKQKYEYRMEIGSGQYSTVHYVKNRLTQARFALKSIRLNSRALRSTSFEQLEQEFNILSTINHPNIIKVEDFFVEDDLLHIVMELADSRDLFDHILKHQGNRIPEQKAQRYARQVLRALVHLHSMQIVHRDLKPENILLHFSGKLDEKGDEILIPKLADFGFAKFQNTSSEQSSNVSSKASSRSTSAARNAKFGKSPVKEMQFESRGRKVLRRTFSRLGTEGYAAPEMLNGEEYDDKVDVWSFGIIVYTMLCGYPPFLLNLPQPPEDSFEEPRPFWMFLSKTVILDKETSLSFPPEVWNGISVSEDAKDLLSRMLQVDPVRRISSREALMHPWFTSIMETKSSSNTFKTLRRSLESKHKLDKERRGSM